MKKICSVVAAGPSPAYVVPGSFVIAADGGLDKLAPTGVSPDLVMGDFDSLGRKPEGSNVSVFPTEKDDTDTMLAVKKALSLGYETVVISGGLGGLLDHTLANLQTLLYGAEQGATLFLQGEHETAAALKTGTLRFSDRCSGRISVFSADRTASGVTLKNLAYELCAADLTNRFPLGVSNHFIGKPAEISVDAGLLLVIWEGTPGDILSPDDPMPAFSPEP